MYFDVKRWFNYYKSKTKNVFKFRVEKISHL